MQVAVDFTITVNAKNRYAWIAGACSVASQHMTGMCKSVLRRSFLPLFLLLPEALIADVWYHRYGLSPWIIQNRGQWVIGRKRKYNCADIMLLSELSFTYTYRWKVPLTNLSYLTSVPVLKPHIPLCKCSTHTKRHCCQHVTNIVVISAVVCINVIYVSD